MSKRSILRGLTGICLLLGSAVASASEPDPRASALIAELGFKAAPTPSRELPGRQAPAHMVSRDLVAALESGHLAGAGLDVTDPEPLPAGQPLWWAMDNVSVTPQVAAQSDVQDQRNRILLAENLRRYLAGEPLLKLVDIARGC